MPTSGVPMRSLRRLLLLSLVLPLLSTAQSFDTTPPTLVNFSFSPTAVDVTAGPQTVTVNLHVSDDLSGLLSNHAFAEVVFKSPGGKQSQTGYQYGFQLSQPGSTLLNANFQVLLSIPQFSESGTWTVSDVYLLDAVGNEAHLTTSALASMFFPVALTVTSIPDTTAPTLTNLTIVPSSIDVSNGTQSVTLSLALTDAQSGVTFDCAEFCYYDVGFTGPSGTQNLDELNYNFSLTSGTIKAGTWSTTITFPRYAERGTWIMTFLRFQDSAGNTTELYEPQLQTLGFSTSVNVASTPTDNLLPVLTGLTISPLAIDTSTGPQTITIKIGLTDNLSGLDFISGSASPNFNFSQLYFQSPSGQQTLFVGNNSFVMESGTPLNGQWQANVTLPQYSEGGSWTLQYLQLQDFALNTLFLNSSQLQAQGFPTNFAVFMPSLTPDGSVSPTDPPPGMTKTIDDTVFGPRASVTFPSGEVSATTMVAVDVLNSPLKVPSPAGFSANPATIFTNIQLTPEPNFPLPAPGLTLVLPLLNPLSAGTVLSLYRVDSSDGIPTPAQDINGVNIRGTVDASGVSATFNGISRLSTAVAYLPLPGTLLGDVNGDGNVNCQDVAIVKAAFGTKTGQTGFDPRADLNNDGVINILDLTIVARQLPQGTVCH